MAYKSNENLLLGGLIRNFRDQSRMRINLKTFKMKRGIISRTFSVAAVLLISFTICFGQEDPYDQVVGTWAKSMGERTITFTMKADHTYQVDFVGDEGIDVHGKFEISGKRITFNDDPGAYSGNAPGIYEFELSDSLRFKWIDDPADGRSMLVNGSWGKAEDD